MRVGLIFPARDIGTDPGAIRAFAVATEELRFDHLVAFDHVVGRTTDPDDYAGQPWREPFVLFGYLAAVTARIELTTGIIILPQRQTALVAKQAVEVDVLSGGRLRLGLGVGWNPDEYAALGYQFHRRGARMDAQLPLLRSLLSEETVRGGAFEEYLPDVGLNPRPGRAIPFWFGGTGRVAARRAAAFGGGVIVGDLGDYATARSCLDEAAVAAGRDPLDLGVEVWIDAEALDADALARAADTHRAAGASHLSVFLARTHAASPNELLARAERVARALLADRPTSTVAR